MIWLLAIYGGTNLLKYFYILATSLKPIVKLSDFKNIKM